MLRMLMLSEEDLGNFTLHWGTAMTVVPSELNWERGLYSDRAKRPKTVVLALG